MDTQRDCKGLESTSSVCQMIFMLMITRVPPWLLSMFAGVCVGRARAAALREEKGRGGGGVTVAMCDGVGCCSYGCWVEFLAVIFVGIDLRP